MIDSANSNENDIYAKVLPQRDQTFSVPMYALQKLDLTGMSNNENENISNDSKNDENNDENNSDNKNDIDNENKNENEILNSRPINPNTVKIAIITSKRERSDIIMNTLYDIGKYFPIYCENFRGGTNIQSNIKEFEKGLHIGCFTVGRAFHVLQERPNLFDNTETVIFDDSSKILNNLCIVAQSHIASIKTFSIFCNRFF